MTTTPTIEELQDRITELEEALRSCARNDKTAYFHHEPRPFDGRCPTEADGTAGTIWLTPREIARRVLGERDLATLSDFLAQAEGEGAG